MRYLLYILNFSLPFSKESLRTGILADLKLTFIWFLIIFFIFASIIILVRTLILRQRKNQQIVKTKTLNEKYHHYLSELASGSYDNKALELMSANKETTLALSTEDFTSSFHRATLLKELLALHVDLAGEAAHKLREVYLTLGYKAESLKKLKSNSWEKRVQGIQELNQMDIKDGYKPLFKLINDRNKLVRLEAILARIKMDVNPLSLFDDLQNDLTEWEQLRIHNSLIKMPLEEVPSFIPYLSHSFTSVQLFSIKMCAIFNQVETETHLLQLLSHEATQRNKTIFESLAEIGSEKSVMYIHEHFEKAENELKVAMIQSLLSISGDEEASFFTRQLEPENYNIQLAAAKALVSLGSEHLATPSNSNQNSILQHAREWPNQ